MKLKQLNEVKYASGKTMERVLKYFTNAKMTYGTGGEEEPAYTIKSGFVAQFESDQYIITDIVLATTFEGKVVWANNSETFLQDQFVEDIKIYRKERVL